MKTCLLYLIILFSCSFCINQDKNGLIYKANEIRSLYPTWESNSVARVEIKRTVQEYLNSQIGTNPSILSDTPMKVCGISERGNTCDVLFSYDDSESLVGVAITLSKVPKDVALSLRLGEYAYITGTLNNFTDVAGTIFEHNNVLTFGWLSMNYSNIRSL